MKSPRIYTRCPSCGNDTLTINEDKHLLCTWIDCEDPTLIDRISEVHTTAVRVRDEWCAEFVKARNALLKIRDATEGCEDGSPDANPHDKLCNEIMGMVREVIADDDENRNDL